MTMCMQTRCADLRIEPALSILPGIVYGNAGLEHWLVSSSPQVLHLCSVASNCILLVLCEGAKTCEHGCIVQCNGYNWRRSHLRCGKAHGDAGSPTGMYQSAAVAALSDDVP